ncbi:MAG: RnfABCDGE type electron transport complex subunit C, partial [Clostridia bacterium]|nr:RnfABCDGE type electron transport complex subunit C [Clostridia bacterium]
MAFSIHGIHVPHRKHTADKPVVRMAPPQSVVLPMSMHIGKPATLIAKVGDEVKVGTKIAEAGGPLSAPIHASVSGKITKIRDVLLSSGATSPAVVIESDGLMTPDETLTPPVINNQEDLINAVRESGSVGMGGAGFPTHVKLNVDPKRIEHLVINCAECEPYITSDSYTMVARRDDMAYALNVLKKILGLKSIVIGIESNKKKAIESMMKLMLDTMEGCTVQVKVLPAIYPQGGEKVLVYNTTGKIIPMGKLPIDVGCIVLNCTTIAFLGSYFRTGMPLVEKCVTVDGGSVKEPQTVIAPIGSSMEDLFGFCGGFTSEPVKLLYGGPMMGVSV